jgi:hypothetical protein
MAEVFNPKRPTPPDDGWKFDIDSNGARIPVGTDFPAYSTETGRPAFQEVDVMGNPPGTEYDANGNVIPL